MRKAWPRLSVPKEFARTQIVWSERRSTLGCARTHVVNLCKCSHNGHVMVVGRSALARRPSLDLHEPDLVLEAMGQDRVAVRGYIHVSHDVPTTPDDPALKFFG